tara:strand:+ start:753 stop:1397 length:645 start_codon:yes stop_codon:yes gene_type:complete
MIALIFMKENSERIPQKNYKLLNGKPLCHWILEECESVDKITKIVINTDSEKIANLCKKFSKVVIQKRSMYASNVQENEANILLEEMISAFPSDQYINLHSTSPMLSKKTIVKAIEWFERNGFDSMFSVTKHKARFYDAQNLPINHELNKLIKTQDLNEIYEENSAFYIFSNNFYKKNKMRISSESKYFTIPKIEAFDIDYIEDWEIVEKLMKY